MKSQRTMNIPEFYEIRVAGHLSENWAARFEGLAMRHEPEGETKMSGMLDQAALHGVFIKIRSLGLKLISVNRIEVKEPNSPGVRNENINSTGDIKNDLAES